ncbi:formylglycine-generating enzyme family protein [Thermodesulfobacteriota bacterium]
MSDHKTKILWALFLILGALLAEALYPCGAEAVEKRFRNSVGMEFVLIPAGTFLMGSPPDEPHRNLDEFQHKVTITKPFYLQTTEVTLKQWRAVIGRKIFGRRKGKGNQPVVKVSWHDCAQFIKKLNKLNEGRYRLPSEAEWEYAARAGSQDAYHWGKKLDCSKAAYSLNSNKDSECIKYAQSRGLKEDSPVPVKSYPPNAWGLYDMHGNVWEWCQDWFGEYPQAAVVDPRGPDSGDLRVRRGGSWFKHGWLCRSANRNKGHSASKYDTLGFRVLLEVP